MLYKTIKLRYFNNMETGFKENLRNELDYHGLTVRELSAKTGIAYGTLNCYIGARASMPPADIALKIANALGVTIEYLINGQEIQKNDTLQNHNIRIIKKILTELNERDIETILGLSKILKSRSMKK